MMDVEEIRKVRLAHPFKPFSLILDDGRELLVEKPYHLGISPTKRFLVHSTPDNWFETVSVKRVRAINFPQSAGATPSDQADYGNNRGLQ